MVLNTGLVDATTTTMMESVGKTDVVSNTLTSEKESKGSAVTQRMADDMPPPKDCAILTGSGGSSQREERAKASMSANGGRGRGNQRQGNLVPNRAGWLKVEGWQWGRSGCRKSS